MPQDPLRQAMCGKLMMMNHVTMPMGRTGADVVAIVDLARQPFDGLNKRIARGDIAYVEVTQYLVLSRTVSSTSVSYLLYRPVFFANTLV